MGEWSPRDFSAWVRDVQKRLDKAQRRTVGAVVRADGALDLAEAVDASNQQVAAKLAQAVLDLNTAQSDIDAATQQISDAFTQAGNAATAASNAQAAAEAANQAALDAAGIAAGKGTIYTQPTAPTPVDPNGLWIDSDDGNKPYRGAVVAQNVDPTGVVQIAPAASAQTERIVTGMDITVAVGVQVGVNVGLYLSMAQNGVVKGSVARLRDGGPTGTVIGSYTYSDKGDSTAGDAEHWDFGAYVTPTTNRLVVTIQAVAPSSPDIYASRRLLAASGSGWSPVQDAGIATAAAAAAAAKAAADAAKATADTAKSTADTAAANAQTALTSAGAAQSAADSASTKATNAQGAADAANQAALDAAGIANGKGKVIYQASKPTGANAAVGNLWIRTSDNSPWAYDSTIPDWVRVTDKAATDAAAAAAAAQTTATNAATAAGNAQTAATNAKSAADAAQSTANAAQSAAGTAQTTADNANTAAASAAGIANGKADVLIQSAAPAAAFQKATTLWIDTTGGTNAPKRWTGSAWTIVTDKAATDAANAAANAQTTATNAATAASNAQAAANTAQAAADAAQTKANGAPQILFGTGTPTGTAPQGSTWFQIDGSGNIIGQWQQTDASSTGSTWTARQMTSQVIANLDVGKLTAGSAAIASLVAQKIAAATASFQTANIANLFVTQGATMAQATIDALFAQVVQAYKITASMIDVNTLNGISLNGLTITGSTITGTTLKSANSGQRTEITQNRITFYSPQNATGGSIYGVDNGAAGGALVVDGGAGSLIIGSNNLPAGGSAVGSIPSLVVGLDLSIADGGRLLDGATGVQSLEGTWVGTRPQVIQNATVSTIVAFTKSTTASSPSTSFITLNADGSFTLAAGTYVMTAAYQVGAATTGRSFVEFIDVTLNINNTRGGLVSPEDVGSSTQTVYSNGARKFRVQVFQTSGAARTGTVTLSVTKVR